MWCIPTQQGRHLCGQSQSHAYLYGFDDGGVCRLHATWMPLGYEARSELTYSAPGIVMHLSLFIDLKKRRWSLRSLILNPYRNLVGMTLDKKNQLLYRMHTS